MKYLSVAELNAAAAHPQQAVQQYEAAYDAMIHGAAEYFLAHCGEKPIILLSGPSGSGKTTTAHRIEALLDSWGHGTHTISMDNYFRSREGWDIPQDEEGNPDLESPLCVDIPLLQAHLKQIALCQPIEIPTFDFTRQQRSGETIPLHRKPGELVVLEGIHALNPEVVGEETHQWASSLYISVRTRVRDAGGYVLHPSKVRLMRRLLRDQRTRGRSFEATVRHMRSVERGERLYIMPHKHHADIELDTFCPYELPVYRDAVLQGMRRVPQVLLEDDCLSDIAPMLRQIVPVDSAYVPQRALIREFVGEGIL